MRVEFWNNIKQHVKGDYFIPLPKAFADSLMKAQGLTSLKDEEVKVEVTL